ncbi:DinB family protein [Paenibacillus tarimensis]
MRNHIIRMFEHVGWADRKIVDALQSVPNPPETAVDLFAHVLAAEKVWLSRLTETDCSQYPIWPKLSPEQCARLAHDNHKGYNIYLGSITDNDLQKIVSYRTSSGIEFDTAVIDILTHVSLHGAYHRGQISSGLRSGGFEPVSTDYILFVRQLEL